MNQFTILLLFGAMLFAATVFSAPVPPSPPVYTAAGQATMNGTQAEYQLGIDRVNSRAYMKTILFGVLVSKAVLQRNVLYSVTIAGPGRMEYSCFKLALPNPTPILDSMDMINTLFSQGNYVSQLGVKDAKNPPSIVLANTFNVTTLPNETVYFFVNPADQSLLNILMLPDGSSTAMNQVVDYSFNRWETKVYDDDFDIPIDVSKCVSSSRTVVAKSFSQSVFPFLKGLKYNTFWQ